MAQKFYLNTNNVKKYIVASNIYFERWLNDGSQVILNNNQKAYEEFIKKISDKPNKETIIKQEGEFVKSRALWPIANSLNDAAYFVLQHSKNKASLTQALRWSNLCVDLELHRIKYLVTQAKILYALGKNPMAITTLEKAKLFLHEKVNENTNLKYLDTLISQINAHQLRID